MTLQHIGRIRNRMHPAAPLIIGDLHTIKDWKGDADGGPAGMLGLPRGEVLITDLELTAPEVCLGSEHAILLARGGKNKPLLDSMALADLLTKASESFERPPTSWTLEVPSGALVVSIAYNPTPEEGSDTSELDDDLFFEGETPMVPKVAPAAPTVLANEMAILPLRAGRYVVAKGILSDGFMKCEIRRAD